MQAMISTLKHAFREIKHFSFDEWEGDYRSSSRQALKEILETRMGNAVDGYL